MTISDVFQSIDLTAPSVTMCSRSDGKTITVMAYKPLDQAWIKIDAPQPTATNQEFFIACDNYNFSMASFPLVMAGYTYQTFVNMNVEEPVTLSTGEIGRLLKIIADAHDRTFFVAPDTNMLMLLSHIPADTRRATIIAMIEFKERRYTVLAWRCAGGGGVESCVVDPPAFDSALRVSGWRQTDPPSHQDGNKYHVMIERNDDGPRYQLSDRTDLQAYKKREEGLVNHFKLAHA